jgi:hypothetical protein
MSQSTACDVWTRMVGLRYAVTTWSSISQFRGLPGLCRMRGISIGNFIPGIVTRYPEIRDFLEGRDDVGRLNILKTYQFRDLSVYSMGED